MSGLEYTFKVEVPVPDMFNDHVNVQGSIDLLEELAGAIKVATGGVLPQARNPNTIAMVVKEPFGVQLGIAPWNASLFLAMRACLDAYCLWQHSGAEGIGPQPLLSRVYRTDAGRRWLSRWSAERDSTQTRKCRRRPRNSHCSPCREEG